MRNFFAATNAYTLADASLLSFLYREHVAYALFREAWADDEPRQRQAHRDAAARHRAIADGMRETLNARLWRRDLGYHVAYNVSTRQGILAKTYVMALPLFAQLVNRSQADAIVRVLASAAMLSSSGLRSTSADDPRYSNADTIVPYSNWRGPMWVNANALACYGLADYGHRGLALEIARRVTSTLAADLRTTATWHEAYSTAPRGPGGGGEPLAGPGFLSWDTLSATLLPNLLAGVNPFRLAPR